MNWDDFYLGMAEYVASKSKDPSTPVGAVIVRPDKTVASVGFNGFPRGVLDIPSRLQDRNTKYQYMIHAELNAILNARESLKGYTLYCSLPPCAECAKAIVQAGIEFVLAGSINDQQYLRWGQSLRNARELFAEANVYYRDKGINSDVQTAS